MFSPFAASFTENSTYVAEVEDRFKSADLDLDAFAEAVKSFKGQVSYRSQASPSTSLTSTFHVAHV